MATPEFDNELRPCLLAFGQRVAMSLWRRRARIALIRTPYRPCTQKKTAMLQSSSCCVHSCGDATGALSCSRTCVYLADTKTVSSRAVRLVCLVDTIAPTVFVAVGKESRKRRRLLRKLCGIRCQLEPRRPAIAGGKLLRTGSSRLVSLSSSRSARVCKRSTTASAA